MRAIDADVFEVVTWAGIPEGYNDTFGDGVDWILEKIDRQPTIEQKCKTGRWIKMSDADGEYYACSECGDELPRYAITKPTWDHPFSDYRSIEKTDFCPSCGADLRERKEK